MLTTRYIGLRRLFYDLLAVELGAKPSQSDLSRLWRVTSYDDPKWEFFLKYAAYCITAGDHVTIAVEECMPSHLGGSISLICVSESLRLSIRM